jgi:hypothetical protein
MTFPFPIVCPATPTNAVDYDGTSDYLSGTQAPTSGPLGILSVWFRLDGGDGTLFHIVEVGSNTGVGVSFNRNNTSNKLAVTLFDTGSNFFSITGTTALTSSATWHHVIMAWNTNFTAGNRLGTMYLDGVSESPVLANGGAGAAFNVNYSGGFTGIAARTTGVSPFNGALAEVYLNTAEYLDLSVSGNRALFRTAGGRPAALGSSGSNPTGSQPSFYLNNRAPSVNINKGSAGDFTIHGAPAIASTTPWS